MGEYYAELHCHSAYSFLHGVDEPATLVARAKELDLSAIAILDYSGMYSAVQTMRAARECGMRTVYGTELHLTDPAASAAGENTPWEGTHLPILANDVDGYRDLCRLLSSHQLGHSGRRDTVVTVDDIAEYHRGRWTILTGTAHGPIRQAIDSALMRGMNHDAAIDAAVHATQDLIDRFGRDHVVVESTLATVEDEEVSAHLLAEVAKRCGVMLVATTAARCATVSGQARAQLVRATAMNTTVAQAEAYLEAYPPILRPAQQMLDIHRHYPQAVAAAHELAATLAFDLELVAPQLPRCEVPDGEDDDSWLRHRVEHGALARYGTREHHPRAWAVIDRELEVISRLGFAGYFLIVADIVDFCRSREILCQGRGSAANSAVCYALGITAVDAVEHRMLFERFLSDRRTNPPDIDVDIEAVRREEVIQYVYRRYGRHHAAQVANVISYRPRSAMADAARALGYTADEARRWVRRERPAPPIVERMAGELQRLPHHLGIHSGGMILTRQPVSSICPVQWAGKDGRTIIQWDKDDCADVGLVKFDLLGLGMLTALRLMFDALRRRGIRAPDGRDIDLYTIPDNDPAVYDLLCAADTVGVFQVESRAQMHTLPRMKPRCFYDIVIEVALVRPGPIHGHAVNPYLRRRMGKEPVTYPHPRLEPILRRTLGVPLFQEQLMALAMKGAGFSGEQADQLRKAMGSKRSGERVEALKDDLYRGMAEHGITGRAADDIYASFAGFAEFGFPESHAFSFAYIVYASAWVKAHYPEEFYAAILAAQPMGFYSPATIIDDAKRHGITVRTPDVTTSQAHTTAPAPGQIILGLSSIHGLARDTITRILTARETAAFSSIEDCARRATLSLRDLDTLALAGACDSLGTSRRHALWHSRSYAQNSASQPTLPGLEWAVPSTLRPMSDEDVVRADYRSIHASPRAHPIELVRADLPPRVVRCAEVGYVEPGRRIHVAGVVTHRQRPATAAGTVFVNLEDETGMLNVVCSPGVWARYRAVALNASAMVVRGVVESGDGVVSLVADELRVLDLPVARRSRDFR